MPVLQNCWALPPRMARTRCLSEPPSGYGSHHQYNCQTGHCCSERAVGKLADPCQPVGTGMGRSPLFSSFPCLQLPAVVGRGVEECELEGEHLFVGGTLRNGDHSIQTSAIIDRGATGFAFIDENFVRQHNFPHYRLNPPRDLKVIDGRPIESGQITHLTKISCQIQDHTEMLPAFITKLGHFLLVLGIPWL